MKKKGKNKVGPEYPGKGAAKTTVAGSIIDDFCIIGTKIILLVTGVIASAHS